MNIPPKNICAHCSLPMLAVLAMWICQPVPAHARTTVDTSTPMHHLSLEELIVTESAGDEQATVIGHKEIQKGRSTTVPDLLKNEPDIAVNRKALMGDTGDTVQIRGMSGNRILLNIDGRPANAAGSHGAYFIDWSTVPLDNVEKIEIIKGGSSVKYGNNASGGVINVVTKKPTKDPVTTLFASLAAAEDLDLVQNYRITHSNKIGAVGFSIGASFQDADEYLWNNDYQAKNIGTKLYFDTPGGGDLSLGVQYTDTTRGFAIINRRSTDPDSPGWSQPFNSGYPLSLGDSFAPSRGNVTVAGPGASWDKTKYLLDMHLTQPIGDTRVIFKAYQNHEDRDEKNYSANWVNPAYANGQLVLDRTVKSDRSYGGTLEAIVPIGASHELDGGIDYKVAKTGGQEVHFVDRTYGLRGPMNDSSGGSSLMWGYFLQDNWTVTDNLLLTPGVRFDTYKSPEWDDPSNIRTESLKDEGLSLSLSATYNLTDQDTFTVAAYRKIVTPSDPDVTWWHDGIESFLYDETLKLETNQGFEFAYQHAFTSKTAVRFSSYYYDIKDYISRFSRTVGTSSVRGCYNIDAVKIAGAAIDGTLALTDTLILRANATYLTSKKEGDIMDTANLTDELEYTPKWKINAGFDWRLPYNLTLSSTARYVDEQYTIVTNRLRTVDSYITVDAELNLALNKNAQVGLFVEDLFDEEYEERYGYALPGRVIGMQMRYTF
ncbi:TonB-dependent receptor plug domain-containing protein [Desulfobulbus oligotrophicus]|uniref:TonB-dependent receptor n=1 Tax=Desulfobulbus oligotrophicus TaxID=1909699 RepID=A0A7T5VB82_9BACT|nr:TonB-dependent receptor [Desulfobulbus oligotrophicus]QQG64684.1 TonB-dependent receptor [Desulfobulbus oligotrophicus]